MKIAVVGFGYVGLRLAIQFARSNVKVNGLDVFAGKKSVEWARATVEHFDLVLVATNHSCVNYRSLLIGVHCIVDTRNAMSGTQVRPDKVWKA